MTDPNKPRSTDPRPASGHRTPREIAEDEAGPIGAASDGHRAKPAANQGPVRELDEEEVKPAGDKRMADAKTRPPHP